MNKIQAINSFADLRDRLKKLPAPDHHSLNIAREKEPTLTKPLGALGRLEEISAWVSAWQGTHPPQMTNLQARIFAGNHGIANQGVSAYPSQVTQQMVTNFKTGGAAVNQLCRTFGVSLKVIPIDLENPTKDFSIQPAMTESECVKAINIGINSIDSGADIICLGEMGIGNSTAAAALCHSMYGKTARSWVGVGSGIDKKTFDRKITLVKTAVRAHSPYINDGLDALARLGGRELAAITGATFAARLKRIPVLLDGFISTSAAAVLEINQKDALDHCLVSHKSSEPGHEGLLKLIKKSPLLDLGLRLGEASGAVLSVSLLKAAVNCHNGMSTFTDAKVGNKIN